MLKVALIQQSNSSDPDVNRAKLADSIRSCAAQGAELIVLQELHDTLYFCKSENPELFDLAGPIPGEATDYYASLAVELRIVLVTSLFERRAPGVYHNTAVVFEKDGSLAGIYRKMHIPDDPGYYEKFYFTPGDLGFNPISTSVGKLGVLVCWDQWYPEAARLMALAGADILVYPTAIGWLPGDHPEEKSRQLDAWITVQRGHAVANGIHVLAVNRTGFEPGDDLHPEGLEFWGNSFAAGPQGEMLSQAPAGSDTCLLVDLDLSRAENVRRWWPFFRDRRIDFFGDLVKRYID